MKPLALSEASPQPEDLVGVRVGNYVLERVVGKGRMGVVYLARDTALLRPTAVKVLSWAMEYTYGNNPTDWFLDEARHVAQINHPRVVQIYSVAKQSDNCYIAMEFVAGPSAELLVNQQGPLSLDRATRIVIDVASALQAAHDAGIVHRDVKPANILTSTQDEWAKLGDFGMALSNRSLKEGRGRARAGTPYYTAPELWQGALASPHSDLYALGATYYYLLTGEPPYPASSQSEVRSQHLFAPLPDPKLIRPDLPQAAVEIIARSMAKIPALRFDSAGALAHAALALIPQIGAPYNIVDSAFPTRRSTRPGRSPLAAPLGPLFEDFGFTRRPFCLGDPQTTPPAPASWVAAQQDLEQQLSAGSASRALVGEHGTGRSAVLRSLAARLRATRSVLLVELEPNASRTQLLRQLGQVCGQPGASYQEVLGILMSHRRPEQPQLGLPLVIVDELSADTLAPFETLSALRDKHQSFSLLGCATPDLHSGRLSKPTTLNALSRSECAQYIAGWLAATRAPTGPPLLFTPDAVRVLSSRSKGIVSQLDRLALNCLAVAAQAERRVITSFEALNASMQEDWVQPNGTTANDLPIRPNCWPTEEAKAQLQRLKQQGSTPVTAGPDLAARSQ